MKLTNIAILLFATVTIACGVDVTDPQAGYFDDHQDKSGTQNFNNMGSGTMEVNINYNNQDVLTPTYTDITTSNKPTISVPPSMFQTELTYIGITKTASGVALVLKNNTEYKMSVKVNVMTSCSVNHKVARDDTYTLTYNFDMYEQISKNVSNWYGVDTIECTGTILSIIPTSSDNSNFQPWTGNYPISTKQIVPYPSGVQLFFL